MTVLDIIKNGEYRKRPFEHEISIPSKDPRFHYYVWWTRTDAYLDIRFKDAMYFKEKTKVLSDDYYSILLLK